MTGNTRDLGGATSRYRVKITETLRRIVEVEARSQQEAEQTVSDNWRNGEYVLSAEDFAGVAFTAVETGEEGRCPVCGNAEIDYDGSKHEDMCIVYKWDCAKCGASGEDWYDVVFAEQTIDRQEGGL